MFVARRICKSTRKTGLEGVYHKRVLREDKVLEYSMLKKLKVTAAELMSQKAMSDELLRTDNEQQAGTARLRSGVKYHDGQAAFRSTSVSSEGDRGDVRDRTGISGNGSGESSCEEHE